MESVQHKESLMDVTLDIAASSAFAENGICYVACRSGLYRSDDRARTLVPVFTDNFGGQVPPVTAVAVAAGGSHSDIVMAAVPGGIVQSRDGGSTWSAAALPTPDSVVSCFAISPNFVTDGTVLAGTLEDGLLRSEDWGGSWRPSNIGLLDFSVLSIIAANGEHDKTIYFVGTTSGVAVSSNGGRSWRESDGSLNMMVTTCLAASGIDKTAELVVAGTEARGLWKTVDYGINWQSVVPASQTGVIHTVLAAENFPNDSSIMVVADRGIMFSPDMGKSWTGWNEAIVAEDGLVTAIAPYGLDPHYPILAGGVGGGVRLVESTLA